MESKRQLEILKLADMDVFTIGGKQFNYRKVTAREFNQLEQKKLAIRKETDPEAGSKLIDEVYRLSAKLYLGMSDEEFDSSPLEDVLMVLEACNYRSMFGKPFLTEKSPTTLDLAATRKP